MSAHRVTFHRNAEVDGLVSSNGFSIVRYYAPPADLTRREELAGARMRRYYRADSRRGTTVYGYEVRDADGAIVAHPSSMEAAKAFIVAQPESTPSAPSAQDATITKIAAFYTVEAQERDETGAVTVRAAGPDGFPATFVVAADGTHERR